MLGRPAESPEQTVELITIRIPVTNLPAIERDFKAVGVGTEARNPDTITPACTSNDTESWTRWSHEIRRSELETTMRHVPLSYSATVLELGSGDGFQLGLLRQRFQHVFGVDPICHPACRLCFVFGVAEALPFPDACFDLIFSNCVVEHFRDRRGAIAEAVRVLKPGGYMAHVVPTRYWKLTSVALNPIGYPLRVAEKWLEARRARSRLRPALGRERLSYPGMAQVLRRWISPPIHGTYPSHFQEYKQYGRQQWIQLFTHPELSLVAAAPLPSSTQFGLLRFRLPRFRRWVGRHGFGSSRAFVLRKRV